MHVGWKIMGLFLIAVGVTLTIASHAPIAITFGILLTLCGARIVMVR